MKDRELVLSKEEISALDRRAIDDGHHDPLFPRLAAEQAVIVFYVRQTDTRFSPVFTQVTTSFISVMRYSVFLASFI